MECSILEPQQRQSYTVTTRGSVATLCHSTGRNLNSQQAVTTAPENTSKQLLRSLWNATRGAQASIERAWPVDGGVRAVWVAACEHDNPSGRPLDRRCRSNNSHWYDFVITRLATGRRRIPTDNRPDAIDERRASYRRRAGRATRHSHYPQPRAGPATARSPQEIARETSCKIGQRLISPVHRAQILWQFLHAAKLMSCLLRSVLT